MKSYQIQKYCVDQQISLSSVGVNQGWNANSSGDDETWWALVAYVCGPQVPDMPQQSHGCTAEVQSL